MFNENDSYINLTNFSQYIENDNNGWFFNNEKYNVNSQFEDKLLINKNFKEELVLNSEINVKINNNNENKHCLILRNKQNNNITTTKNSNQISNIIKVNNNKLLKNNKSFLINNIHFQRKDIKCKSIIVKIINKIISDINSVLKKRILYYNNKNILLSTTNKYNINNIINYNLSNKHLFKVIKQLNIKDIQLNTFPNVEVKKKICYVNFFKKLTCYSIKEILINPDFYKDKECNLKCICLNIKHIEDCIYTDEFSKKADNMLNKNFLQTFKIYLNSDEFNQYFNYIQTYFIKTDIDFKTY